MWVNIPYMEHLGYIYLIFPGNSSCLGILGVPFYSSDTWKHWWGYDHTCSELMVIMPWDRSAWNGRKLAATWEGENMNMWETCGDMWGKYGKMGWYSSIITHHLYQWPFQEPKCEVPTICKAYVREYPHKIWPYKVQYLHFRILNFPLIYRDDAWLSMNINEWCLDYCHYYHWWVLSCFIHSQWLEHGYPLTNLIPNMYPLVI